MPESICWLILGFVLGLVILLLHDACRRILLELELPRWADASIITVPVCLYVVLSVLPTLAFQGCLFAFVAVLIVLSLD